MVTEGWMRARYWGGMIAEKRGGYVGEGRDVSR